MGALEEVAARARLALITTVLGLLAAAGCEDGGHAGPDGGCPVCCDCRCAEIGTIRIDVAGEPDRCLDCSTACEDICARYGTGGMDSAAPCPANDADGGLERDE